MAILLDERSRVLVQGITGQHGRSHAQLMMEYGTNVVAGVTPGKGGHEIAGVPVFDTVTEAVEAALPNVSVILVPPAFTLEAALEAIDARIPLLIVVTEHVPTLDTVAMREAALARGVTLIGPNTIGVICPGLSKAGIMPGHLYRRGSVGVISRSGTLTHEVASGLSARGIGQSTCIGIGGDAVIGLDMVGALELLGHDDDTRVVVLVGEIGGTAEEEAAASLARGYPKPVLAFLAGWTAPPDQRMGHAGAIIREGQGTVQEKAAVLRQAGVPVAEDVNELADLVGCYLEELSAKPTNMGKGDVRENMAEIKSAHLMQVGEGFEPLEFTVTPELNQQYLYAEEDYNTRYIEETESGPPQVHPGLLLNMSNNTRSPSFTLPPGWAEIHAAEDTEYLNPARVGTKLRVTWKVMEAYEKRGRPWHVLDILIVDEDGVEILRRRMTNTFVSQEPTEETKG